MIHFVKLELERVLPELRVEERGQPLRDGCVLGVVPLEDGAGDAVTSEDKQADSLTRAHQAGGRVVSVEDNETLLASDILRQIYWTKPLPNLYYFQPVHPKVPKKPPLLRGEQSKP